MKYTAKVEQFATESPSYIRTVIFEANSEEELDQQLTEYAELGIGEGFVVDDSLKPSRFDESGGFCTRILSFVDENGRDMTFLEKGAF